jgi:hypothetical protein
MKKVFFNSSAFTILTYTAVGFFGYATWSANIGVGSMLQAQDLLIQPVHCLPMDLAMIGMCLNLTLINPLNLLPCKDAIEVVFLRRSMT